MQNTDEDLISYILISEERIPRSLLHFTITGLLILSLTDVRSTNTRIFE